MGTVNPIGKHRASRILRSEGVRERIDDFNEIYADELYLVNGRMLMIVIPHDDVAEVHIAEPKKYWGFIHDDIEEGKSYLFSAGFNTIKTSVLPELKTTINLLIKHGFAKIDETDSEVLMQC